MPTSVASCSCAHWGSCGLLAQHPRTSEQCAGCSKLGCSWQLCLEEAVQSVQLCSHVRLFVTPWTAARQASLSITNSQSLLKLRSIESVMPSSHLILCCPISSCLQSFPASGSFPVSQFFASGGQSIGTSASASVLPMNIQD